MDVILDCKNEGPGFESHYFDLHYVDLPVLSFNNKDVTHAVFPLAAAVIDRMPSLLRSLMFPIVK